MEDQDFTALLEVTDPELIKELDNINNSGGLSEIKIGRFDSKSMSMRLPIVSKKEYSIKLAKKRAQRRKNFLLMIDNLDYMDTSKCRNLVEEYRREHRIRKIDAKTLKSLYQKQVAEQKVRVQQAREQNMKDNRLLGRL